MKKLLCLALCLLFLPLWAAGETEGYLSFVNGKTADRVHLRKAPSVDSESLGLFFTGTPVTCFSDPDQTWIKVKIGAQSGYMMSKFLSTADEAGFEMVGRVKNVPDYVRVLTEPKDGADFVFSISSGETTRVLGETNSHWYCICEGAEFGYVRTKYLSVESVDRKVSAAGAPTVSLDSPYMPVLHRFYIAFLERWSYHKMHDEELCMLCHSHFDRDPFAEIGYVLEDMNGDGTPELLVAPIINGYGDYMLYTMHCLKNGKPSLVVQSWDRSRNYLCVDKMINNEGSSGAASSSFDLMRLSDQNKLEYIEITRLEGYENPDTLYWFATEYIEEYPYGTMISSEEFDANLRRYESLRIQYPLTPFSTLRGTVGRIHVNGSVEGKTTVNIRAGQSLSSKALTSVKTGETVSVIAKNGDWCEVYYNGMHGFIQSQFVLIY